MAVQKVPRAENASDVPTRPLEETELREGLQRMGYNSPKVVEADTCLWSFGRRGVAY